MDSLRKILIIIPDLGGGGAQRTLINLLQKLDYSRYDIDLVVITKTGPYIDQIPEKVNVTYLIENRFFARVLGYLHRTFDFKRFFYTKMKLIDKEYEIGISFLDSSFTNLLFYTDKI